MTDDATPSILIATAEFVDGDVMLTLIDRSKTKAEFTLDPMAVATLGLTLQPAMREGLADYRAKHPETDTGGIPDTLEGL